ncbi:hypothetical protein ACEPAF_9537 [Sanghuangporus sanghuang]
MKLLSGARLTTRGNTPIISRTYKYGANGLSLSLSDSQPLTVRMLACLTPFTAVLLVAASCFVQLVVAGPLVLVSGGRRDVANPPVISPNASTVWVVGEAEMVLWDTSDLPQQITNLQGTVVLGFLNDSSGNEHLMIDSPLASGFDIRSGQIDIVVPDVEPRTDYIIALMGDSGNISDKFTIANSTSSSTSSAPSSTASASDGTSSVESATETEDSPTSTPTAPDGTASSTPAESSATLTMTTVASIGTSEGQSSLTSASGSESASALPSQVGSSTNVSAASVQMPSMQFATLTILTLCIAILA